jgi:hypothetical protein
MNYTPEQHTIIARMGEISRQFDVVLARHREAQATANAAQVEVSRDVVAALAQAIERLSLATEQSNELWSLFKQHGDVFREFLDTFR